MSRRLLAATVVFLGLATVAQATFAAMLSVGLARPDLLLITMVCLCVLSPVNAGLGIGLCGGILSAAMSGVDYGSFLASRIAAGWASAAMARAMRADNPLMPLAAVCATTVISQTIFFVMAPDAPVFWAQTSLGELVYNAILALPIYLVVRSLVRPRPRRDPYMRRIIRAGRRL